MSGKTRQEILEGHLWALDRMQPTLAALFDLAWKSIKDADDIGLWMHNNDIGVPADHDTTDAKRMQFNLLHSMDAAATVERAQQIFASSLFLVLDDWIDGLADALEIGSSRAYGEKIQEAHLADLIRATGNNFRHYREWNDEPQRKALDNIRVLEAAGIHNLHDVIVSSYALQVLNVATYEELESKLRAIGRQMLKAVNDR
jgi:hypothetical protein